MTMVPLKIPGILVGIVELTKGAGGRRCAVVEVAAPRTRRALNNCIMSVLDDIKY